MQIVICLCSEMRPCDWLQVCYFPHLVIMVHSQFSERILLIRHYIMATNRLALSRVVQELKLLKKLMFLRGKYTTDHRLLPLGPQTAIYTKMSLLEPAALEGGLLI